MLNADIVKVRLTACSGPHALDNPQDLPGGATQNSSGSWVANRAIPFSQYRMGMFFGEIGAAQFDSRQNFFQTFSIMYTTVFLKSVVPNLIASGQANNYSQEIGYLSGECSQVYKESQHDLQTEEVPRKKMDAPRRFDVRLGSIGAYRAAARPCCRLARPAFRLDSILQFELALRRA